MESHAITLTPLNGPAITPFIEDLARLRIRIFRDYPYLYKGDLAYEADYLSTYARSARSFFVLARDGERVIGMSTGVPMSDEMDICKTPFQRAGYNLKEIFYFGESVLLPEYRGHGLGIGFFNEREAYARHHGFKICTFCAVDRPEDHPLRPANYVPLDGFWAHRGYRKHPELSTLFPWQDVDQSESSDKPMTFWLKTLER
ncbi:GNAT family N-acetyltransferase [Pokkaliibacter sp. CJK22405]|uniref:GNAT family N-acetyltransferase n=1 Tax=Pokkaliibacter sp. CJK22405 TaxID=3384615 RepID=UPI0039854DB0